MSSGKEALAFCRPYAGRNTRPFGPALQSPVRLNLIAKLAIATSMVLLSTMALFAYLNFNNMKGLLLQEAIADADKISETINTQHP